jgi:hypothetical protein
VSDDKKDERFMRDVVAAATHAEILASRVQAPGEASEFMPPRSPEARGGRANARDGARLAAAAREVLMNLEAARLRLSSYVVQGDPQALEEDRRLERRIREVASWLRSIERGEEQER